MFLMSLHNCNPYGAVQCGPNQAVSMTLCCQQNLTRDVRACMCVSACVLLSPSICVVRVPSWLTIFHLVEVGCMCVCLLSKQRVVLPTCIIPSLDYWKQKLRGVAGVCVCAEVKAARPLSETPMGATLGPSGGQIRVH